MPTHQILCVRDANTHISQKKSCRKLLEIAEKLASKSMDLIMGIKRKYDFFLNWVLCTTNTYVSVRSLHYRARGLEIKFYSLVCFVIQKIAESPKVWLG